MAKKTILIDSDDQEHFFLAVEAGTVRFGDAVTHTEGMARNLRVTHIRCEVEVDDDRDSMTIDEPGALAPRMLAPGNGVRLGHARLSLVASAPAADKPAEPIPPPTPTASPSVPAASKERWLRVVDGANQGRLFRLPDAGLHTIGRAGKADVELDDMYVSKIHCSLEIAAGQITVTHVEGQSGTLIDGRRIPQAQSLKPGNVLRLGNSHLRLEEGVFPAEPAPAAEPPPSNDDSGVWRAMSTSRAAVKPKPDDPLTALSGKELGPFAVGAFVGRGHAGAVYAATNTKSGQSVALKVLASDFPASAAELDRFAKELKAVQQIRHPNLIAQFSAGRSGAHCWISREYVDGFSAEAVIARIAEGEKPSWTRAARVALHLTRALDCLHQHQLVHGNITPRNVLIQSSDHATKLADLHLAEALAGSRLVETIREKKRAAELPYFAPEQAEEGGFVDRLADLYGVGAVSYALVTGGPPAFGKTSVEIATQIRSGWIARPSSVYKKVPAEFDAILMKLLARHPEDRYPSAEAALHELESVAQQHGIKL